MSAAFSAMAMVGAFRFPEAMLGMIEASTTLKIYIVEGFKDFLQTVILVYPARDIVNRRRSSDLLLCPFYK